MRHAATPILIAVLLLAPLCLVGPNPADAAGMHGGGHAAKPGTPAAMGHTAIEVGSEPNPPTVQLVVHKDPKAGWNLQVKTAHFRWAPERASTTHVIGEGHAHLFIDGKKITRLYGEWTHLPALRPGTHTIRVTLNANTHEDYTVNGAPIAATQTVTVERK